MIQLYVMQIFRPAIGIAAVLLASCSGGDETTIFSDKNMFTKLKLDYQNTLVVATAYCPPLGDVEIKFEIEGFEKKWSLFADPSGSGGVLAGVPKLKGKVAARDFENIQRLNERWGNVWPPVFEAFLTVRKDYRYEAPVTKENLIVIINPPGEFEGIVSENWSARFELKEWDGFYFVDFNDDGGVIDSGVSF